jgi:hypothetical protein
MLHVEASPVVQIAPRVRDGDGIRRAQDPASCTYGSAPLATHTERLATHTERVVIDAGTALEHLTKACLASRSPVADAGENIDQRALDSTEKELGAVRQRTACRFTCRYDCGEDRTICRKSSLVLVRETSRGRESTKLTARPPSSRIAIMF